MENVPELLRGMFPLEKIGKDYIQWLRDDDIENKYISIPDEFMDMEKSKTIQLCADDTLTLIQVTANIGVCGGFNLYYIIIGIGKFTPPNNVGVYYVEKGLARFRYTQDIEHYDTELFYSLANEMSDNS